MGEFARSRIVREIEYLFAARFLGLFARQRILCGEFLGFGILRRHHLEGEGAAVLVDLQIADRELRAM